MSAERAVERPLLVSGFEPFGVLRENPSQRVVEHLAIRGRVGAHPLVTAVLPTEYERAARMLLALVDEHLPRAVVALGVAGDAHTLRLERWAKNLDDADAPDNAGERRIGRAILSGGPTRYASTLPVERMHARLAAAGWPVAISTHAGTYVCNHVFYALRHALEQRGGRYALGTACIGGGQGIAVIVEAAR